MMFSSVRYAPQAKWKAGERLAFAGLPRDLARCTLPIFKLPPPGDYDPDLESATTAETYLRNFGRQMGECRGRLPTCVDGELLRDIKNEATGKSVFAELMERARLHGATPIPVCSVDSSTDYIQDVVSYLRHSGTSSVCIRINLSHLETCDPTSLPKFADRLGARSSESVVLIDGGPLALQDGAELAELLSIQMSRIISPNTWGLLCWSCTALPEKIKIKAGESAVFDRLDWELYKEITKIKDEYSHLPVFSDYILEYPSYYVTKGISPVAKLMYSTEKRYFLFKGLSVKKADGYRNIHQVAENLVKSGVFKGENFSSGDSFMKSLADRSAGPGQASKWRWSSADHHIRLVFSQLGVDTHIEGAPSTSPDQLRLV